MKRKLWLLLHRYLGVSAGLVLAVVGVSGALLSFEVEVIDFVNRDVAHVEARPFSTVLLPSDLYGRTSQNFPDRHIQALTLFHEETSSVVVNLSDPNGGRRGEDWYLNPYAAQPLSPISGVSVMHFIEDIHRRLVAGETGKAVVGASVLILVFLTLSGLYLRLPSLFKRKRNGHREQSRSARHQGWRKWLLVKRGLTGRAFWWNLHAVAGTWVFVLYLSASLTGLFFAYEWYRGGVMALAGVEPLKRGASVKPPTGEDKDAHNAAVASGLSSGWHHFVALAGDYSEVTIRIPREASGSQSDFRYSYFGTQREHDRARNRIDIDISGSHVRTHTLYADKTLGEKFVWSMLPLHTGGFYGLPGKVLFFVASLLMPLFTFSGIWLYSQRRAQKKAQGKTSRRKAARRHSDSESKNKGPLAS